MTETEREEERSHCSRSERDSEKVDSVYYSVHNSTLRFPRG